MEKQVILSLPGMGEFYSFLKYLVKYKKKYSHAFRENVVIGSVYGSFPCIWNGGRVIAPFKADAEALQERIEFFNENNITLRFTFTNLFIEDSMLTDYMGNWILKYLSENQLIKNDINTNCDNLREYIKSNYPKLNSVCSTTMCLKTVDDINKYSEDNLVVVDYSINKDWDTLAKLKNPDNIEILANEICRENCPHRKTHYINTSKYILNQCKMEGCKSLQPINYYRGAVKKKHHVTWDEIENKYLPLGINKFKLVGRSITVLNLIEGIVEYMVKPEYKDEVRLDLLFSEFAKEYADFNLQ